MVMMVGAQVHACGPQWSPPIPCNYIIGAQTASHLKVCSAARKPALELPRRRERAACRRIQLARAAHLQTLAHVVAGRRVFQLLGLALPVYGC